MSQEALLATESDRRTGTLGDISILVVVPGGIETGGIGRVMGYVIQEAEEEASGISIEVLDNYRRSPLLSPLFTLYTCAVLLFKGLLRRTVDLVHVNVSGRGSTLRKMIVCATVRLTRIPLVLQLHDYDYVSDYTGRPKWMRPLIRAMFQRADRVVFLGVDTAHRVSTLLNLDESKTTVVPNGVPVSGNKAGQTVGQNNEIGIVFSGELSDRKGVPDLLQCLARPEVRARRWHIAFAGGGKQESRFKKLAQDLGIAERCDFVGWIGSEQLQAIYGNSQIFVLPSYGEGLSVALLEAMEKGLAVICTHVGAHREVVTNGNEAIVVRPGDLPGLTSALLSLMDDENLRRKFGESAKQRMHSNFSSKDCASHLIAIYRGLCRCDDAQLVH